MEIKKENYKVWYDESISTIVFEGSLRLNGVVEYKPISQLLESVLAQEPPKINFDLQKLQFLNSSGINILSKFVIKIRKQKTINVTVIGSKNISWQGKSLKNLQRLMPSLQLEFSS